MPRQHRHAYAADFQRGLLTGAVDRFEVDHPGDDLRWSRAAHRPISTRFEPALPLRGFSTGFSRAPSRLARGAQAIWQFWPASPFVRGCFPPSPASPGLGCPQLHLATATARRWSPCRERWVRSLARISGVSTSVRRDLGVLSSETMRRVRRSLVLSRFLMRFTPCVTRRVPASQSRRRRSAPPRAARSGTPYGRAAWAPVPPVVPIGRPDSCIPSAMTCEPTPAVPLSQAAANSASVRRSRPHSSGCSGPSARNPSRSSLPGGWDEGGRDDQAGGSCARSAGPIPVNPHLGSATLR
jgi:hypothetical protein